ncbi:hypothetical protein NDU88_010129 [Pleurodeles waltl]|uniref:Uncharacterized protein n=1 Tax=Pleurodeles waltl TaxID=8319 RepID=A0AAV7QWH4_PLEWA|nr:hypothetical protein NDU88_010129 [Pleurodeles waltl]
MEKPKRSAASGVAATVLACSLPKSKLKIKEAVLWEPVSNGELLEKNSRKASLLVESERKEVQADLGRARMHTGCSERSASALRQQEKQEAHAERAQAATAPPPRSAVMEADHKVAPEYSCTSDSASAHGTYADTDAGLSLSGRKPQLRVCVKSHRIREGLHGRRIKIQVYPGRRIFISKKRLSPKVKITTEETDFAYPDKGSRTSDPTGRFVPVKKNFKIKTKSEGNFLTEASRDL